jgi:hypothetical protein
VGELRHCGAETHALLPDGVTPLDPQKINIPTYRIPPGESPGGKIHSIVVESLLVALLLYHRNIPGVHSAPSSSCCLATRSHVPSGPSKTLTLARDSVIIVNWTAQSIRPQVQHAKQRIRGSRMERLRVVFEVESTLGRSPGINVTGRKACFEEGVK